MSSRGLEGNWCVHTCVILNHMTGGTLLCEGDANEERVKILPCKDLGRDVSGKRGQQVQRPWGGVKPCGFTQCSFLIPKSTVFAAGQNWVQNVVLQPTGWVILDRGLIWCHSVCLSGNNSFLAGLLGGMNEVVKVNVFSEKESDCPRAEIQMVPIIVLFFFF